MKKHTLAIALLSMGTLFLVGCSDSDDDSYTGGERSTGQVIVLTSNGELASLDADAPTKLVSNIKVIGLRSGDQLVGIDYRPKDGMLYGIGALGNIYTLNPSTGQASFKVAMMADSTDTSNPFSTIVGNPDLMTVNFNPVADRLRVMSNTGQNLRINVDTGATITDGTINSSDAAEVVTAAYTNAVDGTISTRLISLDQRMDRIYLQDANAGTLSSYASLGVNTDGGAAIDIDAENNLAYAALKVAGKYQWAKLDLTTLGTSNNASSEWSALNSYFDTQGIRGLSIKPVQAMAYALGQNNQLLKFALTQPSKTTDMTISGLKVDEKIIGIDYRLRTETEHVGKLYALSNQANLYTIDSKTGAAKLVSTLSADSSDTTAPYTMLDGTHFAVDFNPVADRLRVVSNTGQNLRINVDTGATTTDTPLNGINNASISAGAYTNSVKGSKAPATTRLLNLDQTTNQLVEQTPPNNGTLSPIGNLGITLGMDSGFDIAAGENGLSYAVVSNGSSNTLYKINLMTGAATPAINVNTVPNLNASMVGSTTTPMLIDLAINLER